MKRIMIIGCSGSGKSTLARKLHDVSGIELHHLDQFYWKPNWVETPKKEWKKIIVKLANREDWIIDGNYGDTMDLRIQRADTIVYMDYSTLKCLGRVIGRIWKYYGRVRPTLVEGCAERFDLDFLHYVATYNILRRKRIMKILDVEKGNREVFRLRNNKDIEAFLEFAKVKR